MSLLREVSIENYKSIRKLTMELGRVNVLIGANGSGKSNVLEAIALGSAAARNKLDNEYLVPRGIRVTEPGFMRAAFPGATAGEPITGSLQMNGRPPVRFTVDPDNLASATVTWNMAELGLDPESVEGELREEVSRFLERMKELEQTRYGRSIPGSSTAKSGAISGPSRVPCDELTEYAIERVLSDVRPPDFLIYAPENSALRAFQSEPQVLPLGIRGEGLFAHLQELSTRGRAHPLAAIVDHLALLDRFERLEIPADLAPGERSLRIRDRYLAEGALFDQRSANEGFLFLLFYLTLFISDATPSFFAIDNVESSLDPQLITTLVRQLIKLAKPRDKQVIFTTHNPAVLDALDLTDDEQRLFVTERARDGATRVRRVHAPKPVDGEPAVALSEAFVRGYLGGLAKNFQERAAEEPRGSGGG